MQAVVDGRDWKMKQRRNGLLRLVLQVKEDHCLALTLGQLIDRSKDSPQLVPSFRRVGRIRTGRRGCLIQGRLQRLSPHDPACLMADDLAQPGTKRMRGAQCSE